MDNELLNRIAVVVGAGRALCVHREQRAYVAYCPMRNAPSEGWIECRHPNLQDAINGALQIIERETHHPL